MKKNLNPILIFGVAVGIPPCHASIQGDFADQPEVTVVEPLSRVFGPTIMAPEGSPWCGNSRTYWWVGHQKPEIPYCENSDGAWEPSEVARLADRDEVGGRTGIDRHGCGAMDVNNDGLLDLICTIGALRGTGKGHNEVYITQPDGSLEKVLNHGLYDTPSMRSRDAIPLTGANGTKLLLITTSGAPRSDSLPNWHRLYKLIPKNKSGRLFREVRNKKINREVKLSRVVVADFNSDGLDDLLFCSRTNQRSSILIQKKKNRFSRYYLPRSKSMRSARIADVTGDGVLDLVSVVGYSRNQRLKIFRGLGKDKPYFDMVQPYYEMMLPFTSPDLEVLDVNGDGLMDVYAIQTDHRGSFEENYCAGRFDPSLYINSTVKVEGWLPPLNPTPDILLIGVNSNLNDGNPFRAQAMNHSERGCGAFVPKLSSNELALAQGSPSRPGSNLLLKWPSSGRDEGGNNMFVRGFE